MNAPCDITRSHRETAENYFAEIIRAGRWRLIEGGCGIQWALQYQARAGGPDTARWEGRHYFRSRATAVRLWRQFTGEDGAILMAMLPERFPRGGRDG